MQNRTTHGSRKKGETDMLLGRTKRQEDKLVAIIANLSAKCIEIEKRLERTQRFMDEMEEIKKSMEQQKDSSKDMIDEDGNYNYQKLKQRNLDRRNGKGES